TPSDRDDVERLLARKLHKHGGDVQASLAEAAGRAVLASLARIEDDGIRQSLLGLPTPDREDHGSTGPYVPQQRQRYTLTREHATGGIGRVWLAYDAELGREVALKELRPDRADNPAAWARFVQEARVTGQLEHPGIVPVYELARRPEDGQPFYAMRFVKGQTL